MARSFVVALIATVTVAASPISGEVPEFCHPAAEKGGGDRSNYGLRPPGYCDGSIYTQNAGQDTLSVIGITVGPVKGNPSSAPVLIGLAQVPAEIIPGPLRLRGVATDPNDNYRLDAALEKATATLRIGNESAMLTLQRRHLTAEDVSWLAWSESREVGQIHAPVSQEVSAGGDVTVTVRPTIKAAYLLHEVESLEGRVLTPLAQSAGHAKRGEPISIVIPAGEPRLVVVRLTAVSAAGQTQVATVKLVRPAGKVQ